jgi:hypothetical protein
MLEERFAFFKKSFLERFVGAYMQKAKQKAEKCPKQTRIFFHGDSYESSTKSVKVKAYIGRVVLHATKNELGDKDFVAVKPAEWFLVEPVKGSRVCVTLGLIQNVEEFAALMFENEMRALLKRVDAFVGLEEFKTEFSRLAEVEAGELLSGSQKSRPLPKIALLGYPGTGKSSVMCVLGQLYWLMGQLELGHMPQQAGREEPWLGREIQSVYVGATRAKVDVAVKDAEGGVFALDEAHQLVGDDPSYGKEALEAINSLITSNNNILWVIAGYPADMRERFLKQDAGLASRFNVTYELPQYTTVQQAEIFQRYCARERKRTVHADALAALCARLDQVSPLPNNFGNARAIESIAGFACDACAQEAGAKGCAIAELSVVHVESGFRKWLDGFRRNHPVSDEKLLVYYRKLQPSADSFAEFDKYVRESHLFNGMRCPHCSDDIVEAFHEYRCVSAKCGFIQRTKCCGVRVATAEVCSVCKQQPEQLQFRSWDLFCEDFMKFLQGKDPDFRALFNQVAKGDDVADDSDDERVVQLKNHMLRYLRRYVEGACKLVLQAGGSFPLFSDVVTAHTIMDHGADSWKLYQEELDKEVVVQSKKRERAHNEDIVVVERKGDLKVQGDEVVFNGKRFVSLKTWKKKFPDRESTIKNLPSGEDKVHFLRVLGDARELFSNKGGNPQNGVMFVEKDFMESYKF